MSKPQNINYAENITITTKKSTLTYAYEKNIPLCLEKPDISQNKNIDIDELQDQNILHLSTTEKAGVSQNQCCFKSLTTNMMLPHSKTLKISRCLCDVPAHHKQQLPTQFDSQEIYYRLSLQTLFFIFYYYGGTKAQYFASQALKRRDWRFHTQLNTWCQRSSEPHVICDDYEQGPYITFDFENWVQKSEDNFKFEYRYLEDKIF